MPSAGRWPQALHLVAAAAPKAVAIDVILADSGEDPQTDAALAAAFRATPNLVLASELLNDGWEDPLPEFARSAAALGHVYVKPDDDGITRSIPLEKRFGRDRRWALSLEAFRLSRGARYSGKPHRSRGWRGDGSPFPKVPTGRQRQATATTAASCASASRPYGMIHPARRCQELIDHPARAACLHAAKWSSWASPRSPKCTTAC